MIVSFIKGIMKSDGITGFVTEPLRHWTKKKMRQFLERFAQKRNMDPLNPDTWYSIPISTIRNTKVRNIILSILYSTTISIVLLVFYYYYY